MPRHGACGKARVCAIQPARRFPCADWKPTSPATTSGAATPKRSGQPLDQDQHGEGRANNRRDRADLAEINGAGQALQAEQQEVSRREGRSSGDGERGCATTETVAALDPEERAALAALLEKLVASL